MVDRFVRLASRPRAPLLAALVAVALLVPTLGVGLFADDITHELLLSPRFSLPGGPRGAWDLFRFVGPDRDAFQRALDVGFWPWWSAPNLRVGFFRPLTSLSHALDYRVLGGVPWLLHAESLALYAATCVGAAALYRRVVAPAWVVTVAALAFALDDAHSLTVVWIANRNALFASALGFAAIVAHDRARRDGDRRAAVASPLLFALALLGGEAAIACLAYLAAHALWLDDAPLLRRARALAPHAAVLGLYTAVYKVAGYGAVGSGFYLDPATEPLEFAKAVVTRLPALLLGELFVPPSDVWQLVPPDRAAPLAVVAVALLLAVTVVLVRALREDRAARFFATGMVLSLVPVCATWPNDRLLVFAGLGGAGVVAIFLARVAGGRSTSRVERPAAVALAVVHLVLAPLLLPTRALAFAHAFREYVARADATFSRLVPSEPGREIVVVNAPDMLVTSYVGGVRILRGEAPASEVHVLATAIDGNDGELERLDDRTLGVCLARGFADDAFAKVVRGPSARAAPGDVVHAGELSIETRSITADARPRCVHFRFARPLDEGRRLWLTWSGAGYVPFELPPIGARRPLASIDFVRAVTGG